MKAMNAREKVLAGLVGGTILIVLNVFVFDYLTGMHKTLRRDYTTKTQQLAAMQALQANAGPWQQRADWLQGVHPALENEATAGVQLLSQVQELAKSHGVTVEQPVIATPDRKERYVAVPITLETKSSWESLVKFLHALQGPERFIVLESVNLRVDAGDQTQMRGQLRIAKWFAP